MMSRSIRRKGQKVKKKMIRDQPSPEPEEGPGGQAGLGRRKARSSAPGRGEDGKAGQNLENIGTRSEKEAM